MDIVVVGYYIFGCCSSDLAVFRYDFIKEFRINTIKRCERTMEIEWNDFLDTRGLHIDPSRKKTLRETITDIL